MRHASVKTFELQLQVAFYTGYAYVISDVTSPWYLCFHLHESMEKYLDHVA